MMPASPQQSLPASAIGASGLPFPTRSRDDRRPTGPGLKRAADAERRARVALLVVGVGLAGVLVWSFWNGVDRGATRLWVLVPALMLFGVNALWLGAGAAFAVIGLAPPDEQPAPPRTQGRPGRTAILWLICGEKPAPVAARILAMRSALTSAGLSQDCALFILSDTADPAARRREARAFAALCADGAVSYRNRSQNEGRKPGNIADWIRTQGAGFETMLVLDADSGMSVGCLQAMRWHMVESPELGLVQPGIRLRPGKSRFAGLQRLSARLCGPNYLRGFAAVSGDAANYWGHNALIRVRAFASAAGLPVLPGHPPQGGPVLSHDFVEAAWLIRAGWAVRVLPRTAGSFESAPEALAAFHRRDRRWCQGNLQHLRLIGAPGLHPLSRLHLLFGVQSYLAAPIWLSLLLLFSAGLLVPSSAAVWTLIAVAVVLMIPKLSAMHHWKRRAGAGRTHARRLLRRSILSEIAISTLVAPLVMVRHSLAVAQVLAGQDSGWTPARMPGKAADARLEMAAGAGLTALAMTAGGGVAALILLPVAGPLLLAPWVTRWLDGARHPAHPAAAPQAARPALPAA